eukprot:TRINITY_DN10568_c0_g1_i1.p1 TRINITY_DN10568_c0_g1~~TRINITY_DN10568_c0_g1_i1.p1  ORF type:complete len:375 (-),score=84.07 TRINITY_DN10568_c0_g1_i1:56-1114(-)
MGACCHAGFVPEASPEMAPYRKPLFLDEDVFAKYDKNDNGEIDMKELSLLLKDAFPEETFTDADTKAVLDTFDLDHNGTIGCNELRAFLRHYDPRSHHIKTKTALIIIDVQNDFISGTLANPYDAAQLVPIINRIRDEFDMVAIAEELKQFDPFAQVTLKGDADRKEHTQVLYPRHAVQGSQGAKCHEDLILKGSDGKIYKGTKPNIDSYSAFFDNCKANDTGLTAMLEKAGVTDVYCCGLVTDICVKSTALHGAELGFKMAVIHDASKPLSEDNVQPTKALLEEAGVSWLAVDEALGKVREKKDVTIKEYAVAISKSRSAKSIHSKLEPTMSSHFRSAGAAVALATSLGKK